jgi:hypothetical protein
MSVVSKLISILNRREMGGSGDDPKPKPKKVKDTGLVLYESNEKTPTGKSNSFSSNNKTDEDLIAYAKKYNFPTTSNADFQQAQYDYLNSTPEGKEIINQMVSKYGMPRSGSYADNYLGARASEMMRNIELLNQEPNRPKYPAGDIVKMERIPGIPAAPGSIGLKNFEIPSRYKGYGPWIIRSTDNAVPDKVYNDYDEFVAHKNRGRERGVWTGNSRGEGVFLHPSTREVITQKEIAEQNYDNDVFAGIDLPHEEKDRENLRSPLGVIDKQTGKYIPYRMDPQLQRGQVLYLQKMIQENPELFDLSKQAWHGRKITSEKNQFNPENNALDAKRWGNQYNLMYEKNR